jgi:hypothetical protein
MEEANKRNEAKKFYTIVHGMKNSFQPRTPICEDRDNNLIANDPLILERQKHHFYETLNNNDDMQIWEEVICKGPEVRTEHPTKDEVWETMTLKIISHQGKIILVQNLWSMELKNYGKKCMH